MVGTVARQEFRERFAAFGHGTLTPVDVRKALGIFATRTAPLMAGISEAAMKRMLRSRDTTSHTPHTRSWSYTDSNYWPVLGTSGEADLLVVGSWRNDLPGRPD
jgi:hypothetical protein